MYCNNLEQMFVIFTAVKQANLTNYTKMVNDADYILDKVQKQDMELWAKKEKQNLWRCWHQLSYRIHWDMNFTTYHQSGFRSAA